ncbi:MAG: prolipoprotein diacylglyceryl transferase, partial [Erythrobacter sp.]|nr:prolipoprotein diacylglyceryl transferase [Erythrobacter sp.]
FVNEFFRQPDAQLADFAARTGLSMGQWLTIPLILTGLIVVFFALRNKPLASGGVQPT